MQGGIALTLYPLCMVLLLARVHSDLLLHTRGQGQNIVADGMPDLKSVADIMN